jgi:ATP phosphoribosyltransferase
MNPTAVPAVRERLRIAIQKKGRLAEPARALLSACGLSWREDGDGLYCTGETLPVDLLLVRDDDIPGLIADGVCDMGIVGRNLLEEQVRAPTPAATPNRARELRALGFGACRLMLAVPGDWQWTDATQLQGKRIATTYPVLLAEWLQRRRIEAKIVVLSGSVEIAPRLGQADAICDLVSSGATLAANQLQAVETVMSSEAVLAGPEAPMCAARTELAQMLLRRLDGVLRLRDTRLLLFQAARGDVPELIRLLPDAEPPTVTSIDGSSQVSLQALCRGSISWQRLEDLKRAGANGLMVLPVERMLA